ncbi:DUF2125 domain-containing protein [Thioclava sp. SK-1]|uniref:DUF2125 domain-containing protein n=1 Tax=Thioclava sp. SK-1 TaxID=1889770 RepID=UPI000826BAB9|nr:DUF2125 domain-containing protein [Thioclava sp. SK-1]
MVRLTSVSVAALSVTWLGAGVAMADVTAQQVWDAWRTQYVDFGYQVSVGAEEAVDDGLVIRDLKLLTTDADSTLEMTVPELSFTNEDGAVNVTMSPEMHGQVKGPADHTDPMALDMVMRQSDGTVRVSGTPDAMQHDFSFPQVVVDLHGTEDNGATSVPLKATVQMQQIDGSYLMSEGTLRHVVSNMRADTFTVVSTGADPETGEVFNLSGEIHGVVASSDAMIPSQLDPATRDLSQVLNEGANMQMKLGYDRAALRIEGNSGDGDAVLETDVTDGALDFNMMRERMTYQGSVGQTNVAVSGPELPMPLSLTFDTLSGLMDMPIAKSDDGQAFAVKLGLQGLEISEQIWAMFDPAENLPRDPATLVLDLSGKVKTAYDLFSTESLNAALPPITPEQLTINDLTVQAAGASLHGTGDLGFASGVQMPVGTIELELTGANALADNLVAMGLLPQDQAMFGRMMLGLYAKQTGDDALETEIEFGEDGSISANGQRIQ